MQTAKIRTSSKGVEVVIPAPVMLNGAEVKAGVETFGKDKAGEAMDRLNAINEAYEAEAAAVARRSGPGIEILSLDGKPFEGFATVQATDREVFKSKPDPKKGRLTETVTTEKDLCNAHGFVLVTRDGSGKVKAEWGNPPDFGRYAPITAQGLSALRRLLVTQ